MCEEKADRFAELFAPGGIYKTAVGWILREVSKHDGSFVRNLIDENMKFFSTESLRNATKYFSKDERKTYLNRLKGTQQTRRS